jgi:(S)-ureidoglycine aminohydrolase
MAELLPMGEVSSFMQNLGFTRSSYQRDHLLLTPDTFVRSPLPGMSKCTAIVHAAPAVGARFIEYTAEFEPGGRLGICPIQRFLYVLEGELSVDGRTVVPGGYAYQPGSVTAVTAARAVVIEKEYIPAPMSVPKPAAFLGHERNAEPRPLGDDPDLQVRVLIPEGPAFDFAVNTMTFAPGAALSMVEIHVMEHGLLMLEGGGIYRLGEKWYPVTAGDFIWMASYCPQWFGAIGKQPAKYLIYKDWNR